MDDLVFFGFADGASRHTRNIASAAWVPYYPTGQLMASRGVCISPASNNMAGYTTVINLLSEALSYGIDSLVVYLDSQLIVSQLNNIYTPRAIFFTNPNSETSKLNSKKLSQTNAS